MEHCVSFSWGKHCCWLDFLAGWGSFLQVWVLFGIWISCTSQLPSFLSDIITFCRCVSVIDFFHCEKFSDLGGFFGMVNPFNNAKEGGRLKACRRHSDKSLRVIWSSQNLLGGVGFKLGSAGYKCPPVSSKVQAHFCKRGFPQSISNNHTLSAQKTLAWWISLFTLFFFLSFINSFYSFRARLFSNIFIKCMLVFKVKKYF